MKEQKILQIIGKYLLQYRFTAAVFVLFAGIFAGIVSLYQIETEAIAYAAMLCVCCAIIFLMIHFSFYLKKHLYLTYLLKNIELLPDNALTPSNLVEEDYCALLKALQTVNESNLNAWKAERSDSQDYYTTWVHQIKAPIAVMRLVLQSQDTAEYHELLSELFRIEQYTEMALCYMRLDSISSDFILKTVRLDDVLRQAIRKFASEFVCKKIRLQYEGTNVQVLSDEKWLLFIIEQLLSNAVKYTKKGLVIISVSEQKLLQITDTGIGIAAEDLPRIFEKGYTGYNGHADKKATGLGLYLCKRAAKQLSHTLSVTSRVGKGSTVTIDLSSENLNAE